MKENKMDIESKIEQWRNFCLKSGSLSDSDMDELEDHLREEIQSLKQQRLSEEEAFLVAVSRMGNLPSLSAEFRKINTHNLWKNLFVQPVNIEERQKNTRDLIRIVSLAIGAGLLTEVPRIFGIDIEGNSLFYIRNMSFFVLPFITAFFIMKRSIPFLSLLNIIGAFSVSLLLINLYPFAQDSHTFVLSSIHLPLFLWFFTGIAYTGSHWKDHYGKA